MRFPWSKPADDGSADSDEELSYDDEPEGDEEPEDPLADLDEEQRQRAETYAESIRKEEQAKLQQARGALQQAGLDVVDGKLVGDPQKFAAWAQPASGQPQPAPQPAAAAVDEDEAWPDPTYDRAAFEARLDRLIGQREAKAREEGQAMQQTMQGYILDDAVLRAQSAIREHLPLLEPMLQHPEFGAQFKAALATADPSQWRDPIYLARVAGAIAPQLLQGWTPPAARERGGRPAPEPPRGSYDRHNLQQLAPASGGGRGGQPQYSEIDRMFAEREGITVEEAAALDDPTYERVRALQARTARGRR